MNAQQTIEKMKMMRLTAMAELYHQSMNQNMYQELTTDEWMTMLIDHQWEDRQNKKINSLIHRSAMTQNVSVQDIDYTSVRKLDKTQYERMLSLQFIQNKENIIITGPAGIGKSYLAQGLGYQACRMLHKTQYSELLTRPNKFRVIGSRPRELKLLHIFVYAVTIPLLP